MRRLLYEPHRPLNIQVKRSTCVNRALKTAGTMPLPTGVMPHSTDFAAPTDYSLHLPSSKLDSRRPASRAKNIILKKMQDFDRQKSFFATISGITHDS